MKPNDENLENYGKLCRERTKKHMKSRKIQVSQITLYTFATMVSVTNIITNLPLTLSNFQVIDNDNGARMRPMPGMIGFVAPGPSVLIAIYFLCLFLSKIAICCLLSLGHSTCMLQLRFQN